MKNNNDNLAYSIASAPYYLKVAEELNLTLAFVGAHGRAKTAFVKSYCKDNGYDEVITVNLAQMAPEDMIGIPITGKYGDEDVTNYTHPSWFVKACDPDKKVCVFFDEINNGEDDTQAAILTLINERELFGRKVNDSTLLVAAFNPPEIAPNARDFSKATRDRMCVIPIQDENKDPYKDYYRKNDMGFLADLLEEIPELVNDYSKEVVECAYENAEFTFRSLENSYRICDYVIKNKMPQYVANAMVRGYAGRLTGDTFVKQFYETYQADSEAKVIADIAKNASKSKEISDGLNKNGIKLDRDFAELVRIVHIIESNADPVVFEDFLSKHFTREFVVGYINSNK